jgi:hypothetical protein
VQRIEPPACSADPVREGRSVQRDALAGEDLGLPVERQVVAVVGSQIADLKSNILLMEFRSGTLCFVASPAASP